MQRLTAADIKALWGMTLIALVLIADAATWKIDHVLWSLGIAAVSGLAGYNIKEMIEKRREK